ncbi:UvrD-helicase domain-containing protein [Pseudomonas multiresinivorans]|uniref:DNA 3'-5' helicase n=1 Tax=Pseudomonas multiresinivorans TaxID=95301 RepID=A0A7Z3GSA0_9PSED|nr:UvrD-helicase domain-containing protein [Pseudomonas multiresinivorans]QJP10010.1 UvrD-helicase domain-containing protein [Pseudomonas multiresinivorans]
METGLETECSWTPTRFGRLFTNSPKWEIRLIGERLELLISGRTISLQIDGAAPVKIKRGWLWASISYADGRVSGLPKSAVKQLNQVISGVVDAQKERAQQDRAAIFTNTFTLIRGWLVSVSKQIVQAKAEKRWITSEQQDQLTQLRPLVPMTSPQLDKLLLDVDLQQRTNTKPEEVQQALQYWRANWQKTWATINEKHTVQELADNQFLLGNVERKPLTEEQARAVICFDNRVQVVASAGSGKTSVMVAKAAYAIQRGFARPEEIVMLAFNKDAAEELAERAKRSFERVGMAGAAVSAQTFHKLGLDIIGAVTKKKPSVPDWAIEQKQSIEVLSDIVDRLKDSSPEFRIRWDLFRLVFGRDLPSFRNRKDQSSPGSDTSDRTYTLRGEYVRSVEECMIANWLFYNGVNYVYEPRYEHDTATETHRQYHPDFYYPELALYHEHFALDGNGQPPSDFKNYLEGVRWKREQHAVRGTSMIETTSFQLQQNTWIEHLTTELTKRGVVLDPNPDRPIPANGQAPIAHQTLLQLLRTFITHTKSNCLTATDLSKRIDLLDRDAFKHRYRMFLDILLPVLAAWNKKLSDDKGIDFEDMLNLAAQYIEEGRYRPPYRLVMADEFQDASRARARLCQALVKAPGRFFFAVGDDWQSINRFAGADVSVMTSFKERFGSGQILRLEKTFRCPQGICDVSSQFVSKNPAQLKKQVQSVTPAVGPTLQAYQVKTRDETKEAIATYLASLVKGLQDGSVPSKPDEKIKVYVLGRYNQDRRYIPDNWATEFGRYIDLSFLSIHRSKGAEADYVILPAMVSTKRSYSFPSTIADDPIMSLAMPGGETYPFGEERRLFYVALTRAKRSVAMFTVKNQVSVFLKELVKDGAVKVIDPEEGQPQRQACPACKVGEIVKKTSKYGDFLACSNYPACEYKPPKRASAPRKTTYRRYPKRTF